MKNVLNTLCTCMKVSKNKIIQTNILKNDTEWMIPKPRIFEYLILCTGNWLGDGSIGISQKEL